MSSGLESPAFARVRELFHTCCDMGEPERGAYLSRECGEDAKLRGAVEELIAAERSGTACGRLDAESLAGTLLEAGAGRRIERIGRYTIDRVLGEGGMGVAYLGRQADPDRLVAIKVLRGGWQSQRARTRFAREVKVLGRLSHPGIAVIYEAGEADAPGGALAYFAMEYVDGPRITEYAKGISFAEKLELMARVADAVQYAHTRGVIHRDLKPANVLVKEDAGSRAGSRTGSGIANGPTPVILDFGVARLLEGEEGGATLTEAGAAVGTVEYMSPEQFGGDAEEADARSDVYSMGVMLYEVLAGRLPHDLKGKPLAEAARVVRDEEPRPLVAADRLDRDTRTILQKAMAKDRERRYATAAALAEDIRRYLRHEPILARPATVAYQVSRFARRHRPLVAGAVLAVLSLAVGLAVSVRMYARAERERERADGEKVLAQEAGAKAEAERARADEREKRGAALLSYIIEDLLKAPAPDRLGASATMIDALLAARQEVAARFAGQPELEADVRSALADVLDTVGKPAEAIEERDAVYELRVASLGKDHELSITAEIDRAGAYMSGQRWRLGREYAEAALSHAREVLAANHPLVVRGLRQVGRASERVGGYGAAVKSYREALDIVESRPERDTGEIVKLLSTIMRCECRRKRFEAATELGVQIEGLLKGEEGKKLPAAIRTDALTGMMALYSASGYSAEAVSLAEGLEAEMEQSVSPALRGYRYRRLMNTYEAAGRMADAERCGLITSKAFGELFPLGSEQNEWAAGAMVRLYANWPGHEAERTEWAVRLLGWKLILSRNGVGKETSPSSLAAAFVELRAAMKTMGAQNGGGWTSRDAIERVWSESETIAPAGYGRRAEYFANLAMLARSVGENARATDAFALAERSLEGSSNRSAAEVVVARARQELER